VIHPVPLLRSWTPVEPMCPCLGGHIDAAPACYHNEGFGRCGFRGSLTQLQHLLSYASRFVLPFTRKAGFRLAGWPLPGVSNPLDHYERFQITWSSPFPVLLTLDSCRADPTLVTAALGPGCVKTQSDLVVMPRGVRPTSFTMVLQRPESQRGQAWSRDQNRSLRDQGRRPAGDRRLTEPEFRQ